MLAAILISILVFSMRSCNDQGAEKADRLGTLNLKVVQDAPRATTPIEDYRIRSIENGEMTVDAGDSLSPGDVKTLATRLTQLLHDDEHEALHSDLVMVDIERGGKIICSAQTSAQGIWVKLK